MFILDSPNIIGKRNFWHVKNFIKSVIRYFRIGPSHVQIGSIIYNAWVRDEFDLDDDQNLRKLFRIIDNLPHKQRYQPPMGTFGFGKTSVSESAYNNKRDVMHVAVVVTSYKINGLFWMIEQAKFLKNTGVKVFVVAVGPVNTNIIEQISSNPYGWFIQKVPSYKVLGKYEWILAYKIYWGK